MSNGSVHELRFTLVRACASMGEPRISFLCNMGDDAASFVRDDVVEPSATETVPEPARP